MQFLIFVFGFSVNRMQERSLRQRIYVLWSWIGEKEKDRQC